jgi:preprotein translocase subunit SecG
MDRTTLIYAVVALVILFILVFVASNLRRAEGTKKSEAVEDADEAKLDATLGEHVDPAPLSTPEKNP